PARTWSAHRRACATPPGIAETLPALTGGELPVRRPAPQQLQFVVGNILDSFGLIGEAQVHVQLVGVVQLAARPTNLGRGGEPAVAASGGPGCLTTFCDGQRAGALRSAGVRAKEPGSN